MKAMFKVTDIIVLGLTSLTVHKFRSFLTALGILFGVWSVIAMLAINEGASYESQQALREMGTDNLLVESVKPSEEDAAAARERGAMHFGLTKQDVERLTQNIPGVRRWVAAHRTQKAAMYGTKFMTVNVVGTRPEYMDLARLRLASGRFIAEDDCIRASNCAVMTVSLARKLFDFEDPIGKPIRLGGLSFMIVGLVEEPGRAAAAAISSDAVSKLIFVADSCELQRFGKYTVIRTGQSSFSERVEVSQLILQMTDEDAVIQGANIARSLLGRNHEKKDYQVTVPLELIEQSRKQRRLWNIMFFMIASVSLLVGGIGIVNIMLASVNERTREIGIRRALGAKRRDITIQFLVEAISLTTLGGLMGIGVGLLVPVIVESALQMKTVITAPTILLPFMMAIIVGLISGIYPAFRAARLDPIRALRHE